MPNIEFVRSRRDGALFPVRPVAASLNNTLSVITE